MELLIRKGGPRMDRYLLTMFDRHPRRFRVIENTVRNKSTQATLFWGLNYGILNWQGSAPELTRQQFDQWLRLQQRQGFLQVNAKEAQLTSQGMAVKQEVLNNYYHPQFDQWAWLISPRHYAERFLLAIQAVSELSYHNRHYVPLNIAVTEMTVVRNWLDRPQVIEHVHQELQQLGEMLSQVDERLAVLFANQLIGHEMNGWTFDQAQDHFQVHFEEVQVMNRDVWLGVASYLARHPHNALAILMADLLAPSPVSRSAYRTLMEFQRGAAPEQIARSRHLKVSTIREHLLEVAIIIPQALDWQRLISQHEEEQIRRQYTGPVQQWQFKKPVNNSEKAFFKFRLCQIKELQSRNG